MGVATDERRSLEETAGREAQHGQADGASAPAVLVQDDSGRARKECQQVPNARAYHCPSGSTTDMNVGMGGTHLCVVAHPYLRSPPHASHHVLPAPSQRTMHASDIDGHNILARQMQEDDVATFSPY